MESITMRICDELPCYANKKWNETVTVGGWYFAQKK
jgi:hypothetical protein